MSDASKATKIVSDPYVFFIAVFRYRRARSNHTPETICNETQKKDGMYLGSSFEKLVYFNPSLRDDSSIRLALSRSEVSQVQLRNVCGSDRSHQFDHFRLSSKISDQVYRSLRTVP